MGIIWTIIIGFVAGVIAKLVTPGSNEPSGFILTTILGIVGAFVASWLGQALGWYGPEEGAGLIGAVVGAIIVLLIWGAVMRQRTPGPNLIASPRADLVLDLDCYLLLAGAFSGILAAAEGGKLRNERWYEEGVSTITADNIIGSRCAWLSQS